MPRNNILKLPPRILQKLRPEVERKETRLLGRARVPLEERRQIYLPTFTLTLLRTPHNPPTWASFYVPLNFNKLDLRDFLLRAYGVEVTAVRSYVQYRKMVHTGNPRDERPSMGRHFRPQPLKKMTVIMREGFMWPAEPEDDYEAWEKSRYDAIENDQRKNNLSEDDLSKIAPRGSMKSIAEQAKEVLEGKRKWRPSWEEFGYGPKPPGTGEARQ